VSCAERKKSAVLLHSGRFWSEFGLTPPAVADSGVFERRNKRYLANKVRDWSKHSNPKKRCDFSVLGRRDLQTSTQTRTYGSRSTMPPKVASRKMRTSCSISSRTRGRSWNRSGSRSWWRACMIDVLRWLSRVECRPSTCTEQPGQAGHGVRPVQVFVNTTPNHQNIIV